MLKYSFKVNSARNGAKRMEWREKYISSDMSFISGVTSSEYHLDKYTSIVASNPKANQDTTVNISTEVVTRLGYVIAKGKEYKVSYVNDVGYVSFGGRFFYDIDGVITVKDWLSETTVMRDNSYVTEVVEKEVKAKVSNGIIKLDTIYWIEDGYVMIDGYRYIFDKNEMTESGSLGSLRSSDDGSSTTSVTRCDSIVCVPYNTSKEIHEVCKFTGTTTQYDTYKTNTISFVENFFFISYMEHSCPIDEYDDGYVMCEYPDDGDVMNMVTTSVILEDDVNGDRDAVIGRDLLSLNDLAGRPSYVEIDGEKYYVKSDFRITQGSDHVAVDLVNRWSSLKPGDVLTFEGNTDGCALKLEEGNKTLFYNGMRYTVEANKFDIIKIEDVEYIVSYDEFDTSRAYVDIEGERVPMKLQGDTLTRFGKVIKADSSGKLNAVTESFTIEHYSGVTIDGRDYPIYESNGDYYAYVTLPIRYKVMIDNIVGDSLVISTPVVEGYGYSDDDKAAKKFEVAEEIVTNQSNIHLQCRNTLFGLAPLTKDYAFTVMEKPSSSDDADNVFDKLTLYVNGGYVNLPLALTNAFDGGVLKQDTILKDFAERERAKAINEIVDMEKDVYSPKYMVSDKYVGAETEFKEVRKINVNLHFRTRNLVNWKVNNGYDDITVSGTTDSWFITDYEPYKTMLAASDKAAEVMIGRSDLVGFLNFDGNDVFYQKTKIANSFLRMSVYDTYDEQNQSLLSTDSVFLDEHKLYKKYIDNSRKGVNTYMTCEEALDECIDVQKIRVNTERVAKKGEKGDILKIDTNKSISMNDDGTRLDSRLTIVNKYETDTSSEGFYLYIFREYSENLHPKPIYMKIEFNHAGVGRTIPFTIPMKWEKSADGNLYPKRPLTMKKEDLEELKGGYPAAWVRNQLYIPLYAVYDFKNKEYAYVFDDRYVDVDEDGTVNLNLFELKVMDESNVTEKNDTIVINGNEKFMRNG